MARAISNLTSIGFVAEVTAGTTPTSPTMLLTRATSETFKVGRNFTKSEQFNALSQVNDQILVANDAMGGFSFEWADGEAAIELLLEATLWGAWSTDVLLAGVTRKSISCEVKHEAGTNDQFKLLTGLHGNELSLDFNAAEKIVGSFGLMGMTGTFATSAISGATYTAAGTEPVSVTGDMALVSDGLSVADVTKMSLRVNNNCRQHRTLGSFNPTNVAKGTTEVTGDIEMFLNTGSFEEATAFLANTAFALSATAGNTTGKMTEFEMNNVKFNDFELAAAANSQDLMIRAKYEAFYHAATGSALKVTRNVA